MKKLIPKLCAELAITQSNYDQEKAQHSSENWAVVIDGLKKLVENKK
jgi:hypothetical protein